jgi:hypothetical protein
MPAQVGKIVIVLGLACTLAAAAPTTSAPAPTTKPTTEYQIKLFRPEKVGNTYKTVINGSERRETSTTVDGKRIAPKPEGIVYEISGVKEITKINDRGQVVGLTFTVEQCLKLDGDKKTEVLPKDTVVLACVDGKTTKFVAKDSSVTLPPDAFRILPFAIDLNNGGILVNDDTFGTTDSKKVGEVWPVNSEFVAKDFNTRSGMDLSTKKEDVTGEAKLVGVKETQGMTCLDLRLNVTTESHGVAPAQLSLKNANLTVTLSMEVTGLFPVDGTTHALEATQNFVTSMKITSTTGAGTVAITEMRMEHKLSTHETKISKD